jgi:class 3 adenylate cyclase
MAASGPIGEPKQSSLGRSTVENKHVAALSKLHLHTPPNWEEIISKEELHHLLDAGDQTGVHVVAGDIRGSTLLMREAISSREYATIATSFAEIVLKTAQETSGWFDRFTGDGFIVYWIYSAKSDRFLGEVMTFCARMHSIFEEVVLPQHRKNARNLPAHVGLSLGIDSGRCSMEVIAGDFTMIGHAVVGAVRMVDAARKGETLCNIRTGQLLLKEPSVNGVFTVNPIVVRTKEYSNPGQEAYSIVFK